MTKRFRRAVYSMLFAYRSRSTFAPTISCSRWFSLVAIGFVAYARYHHAILRRSTREFGWKHIAWLLPWFGGLWLLSWLGGIGGGLGAIGFGRDSLAVSVWSVIVYVMALRCAPGRDETAGMMVRMNQTS